MTNFLLSKLSGDIHSSWKYYILSFQIIERSLRETSVLETRYYVGFCRPTRARLMAQLFNICTPCYLIIRRLVVNQKKQPPTRIRQPYSILNRNENKSIPEVF